MEDGQGRCESGRGLGMKGCGRGCGRLGRGCGDGGGVGRGEQSLVILLVPLPDPPNLIME